MKYNKTVKLSLSITISAMFISTPTVLSSCSSNGVVLANFESYMSSDLMAELHHDYSIKFVNYSTNEDILAKFTNSYDIAVPSTYAVLELIKQGLCGQLD
jgi:spermidine/putrescine-binding protein